MKTKFLTVLLLGLLLNSCKKEKPGTNEIFIQSETSNGFNPSSITINKGTTVTWTNKHSEVHTVTSNTGAFNSGDLTKGKQFAYTFTTAGTYAYHCIYHSPMKATVIVQ